MGCRRSVLGVSGTHTDAEAEAEADVGGWRVQLMLLMWVEDRRVAAASNEDQIDVTRGDAIELRIGPIDERLSDHR